MSSLPSEYPHHPPVLLIADDEPAVLEVLRSMARSLGWRTLLASSGPHALELFRTQSPRVDCALVDLFMPHMDGRTLADALRRERPGLPVVLMTGDSAVNAVESAGACGLLMKPFLFEDLSRILPRVHEAAL